jgi:hypothetical protein
MTHSKRTMLVCIAVVLLAVALAVAFANPTFLLFLIPCMLMMGVMVWMMMGGVGGMGGPGQK